MHRRPEDGELSAGLFVGGNTLGTDPGPAPDSVPCDHPLPPCAQARSLTHPLAIA